jgi:hypothetical protein
MKRHLIPLVCLLAAANLHANGGGYITGVKSTGAFQPIGIDQVEMISERLEIDLHIEYADIRIEYVLHNPDKKVKIEAGFPSGIYYGSGFMMPPAAKQPYPPKLEQLDLKLDGANVKHVQVADDLNLGVKSQGSMAVNSWHKFSTTFASGQTSKLTVSYRAPYQRDHYSFEGGHNYSGPLTLTYLFSAAAAWAGPIKNGSVIIRSVSVPVSQVNISHPKRFTRNGNVWTWSFTDFEPTLEDDLIIHTRGRYDGNYDYTGEKRDYTIHYVEWRAPDGKNATGWEARRQDFSVEASSSLTESDGTKHPPEHLKDWTRKTAWVEGKEGDGVGEHVTLTLPRPAKIRRIGIVNGYAESRDLYLANNRISRLKVSINGGKSFMVEIPDEHLVQEHFWFDLPASKDLVKIVRLEIAAVYPGTTFKDTAIADVVLVVPLDKEPKIQPGR